MNKKQYRARNNIQTTNPYLLFIIIKYGGNLDFLIKVKGKALIMALISTRKQLDDVLTLYEEKNINYLIQQISLAPTDLKENANVLSFEESKILETAIKSGFFDVPRKISLEELAINLGLSKSWDSELLRKIIKKKVLLVA